MLALLTALFFALNIGASGTAAAMGESYGGGAIRQSRTALILVAVCALAGAVIGGSSVTNTMGKGIVDASSINPTLVVVILSSACLTLFAANLLGIPLSTSEVTVGAVVGVGIALGTVYTDRFIAILVAWLLLPLAAFLLAAAARRTLIPYLEVRLAGAKHRERARLGIGVILITAGCYQAFGAGMNNVANAVGPLISADIIGMQPALVLGGLGMAVGAWTLGGRVLETNAKRITRLSLLDAAVASLTGGTVILFASLAGIPVPLTQLTAAAIMGIGFAKRGGHGVDRTVVRKILKVWAISPVASLLLAMGVTGAIVDSSTWSHIAISSGLIAASVALLLSQGTSLVRLQRSDPAKE